MFASTLSSCEWRCCMSYLDSWYLPPPPIYGSKPMWAIDPSLILQARLFLMSGREWRSAFQTDEMPDLGQIGKRIQSIIFWGQIYLWYVMAVQRFCPINKVHPIFAASAYVKKGRSFRPHLPHFLGNSILLQPTHAKIHFSWFPFQRYLLQICCKRAKMLLGIQGSVI